MSEEMDVSKQLPNQKTEYVCQFIKIFPKFNTYGFQVERGNYQNHEKRLQDKRRTGQKIISNNQKELGETNLGVSFCK